MIQRESKTNSSCSFILCRSEVLFQLILKLKRKTVTNRLVPEKKSEANVLKFAPTVYWTCYLHTHTYYYAFSVTSAGMQSAHAKVCGVHCGAQGTRTPSMEWQALFIYHLPNTDLYFEVYQFLLTLLMLMGHDCITFLS